jgi:hypothetical protein
MVMGQFMTALTGWPLRCGTVKRALDAMRLAGATRSGCVDETTRRMDTEPEVESSTSKVTVPWLMPKRATDDGKGVDP